MIRLLSGCFLFVYSLLAFSVDMLTVNVDASSRHFTITLPANPTTGYQWTVKQYDKTFLQLTNSKYRVPKNRLMGAGGEMAFMFSRVKNATYPDSTILQFCYARSWEQGSGTMKKVTVYFKPARLNGR